MAIDHFNPDIWSARMLNALQKTLVFGALCNKDYEGEITGQGCSVKINSIGAVTVAPYVKNTTEVSPETLTSAQTSLLIDQANYFAFEVDDVDKAQQSPKVIGSAMKLAGYGLRDQLDQYIAGMHAAAGTQYTAAAGADVEVGMANVNEVLATVGQYLDEANVPAEDRYIIVPPWLHTKLVLAKIMFVGDEAYTNGRVGRALGFDVHVSNNVANTVGAAYKVLAGTPRAVTLAEQILSVEAFRPEASFSDAVKGLHVFGAKVVDPNALVCLTCAPAVEGGGN